MSIGLPLLYDWCGACATVARPTELASTTPHGGLVDSKVARDGGHAHLVAGRHDHHLPERPLRRALGAEGLRGA
ncbi:MAG TPA: hypothetical protein VF765_11085 [Polyangiaceae bacterium]